MIKLIFRIDKLSTTEITLKLVNLIRAWTVQNKKEPSTFLESQSKDRQVISSKFPKILRGARDLVAFYDFFYDFSRSF